MRRATKSSRMREVNAHCSVSPTVQVKDLGLGRLAWLLYIWTHTALESSNSYRFPPPTQRITATVTSQWTLLYAYTSMHTFRNEQLHMHHQGPTATNTLHKTWCFYFVRRLLSLVIPRGAPTRPFYVVRGCKLSVIQVNVGWYRSGTRAMSSPFVYSTMKDIKIAISFAREEDVWGPQGEER